MDCPTSPADGDHATSGIAADLASYLQGLPF